LSVCLTLSTALDCCWLHWRLHLANCRCRR